VWVVTFPGSEMLDLSGPWEVLSHSNEVLGYEAYSLQLVTPLGGEVRTRHGLRVSGARSLRSVAQLELPDILLIAGGSPRLPLPTSEAELVRWLGLHHERIPRLVSICTGAFVLGEAGLLDRRRCTTHWRFSADLRVRFPKALVVDDGIYECDGPVWTSAGITAGIDLTLALVEERHGRATAMAVAKNLLLFLRRSGRQAQFSESLKRQEREPAKLRDVTNYVLEHLEHPLPVERLARDLGMSSRSLARWCRDELGESPAALVRRLRIDEARRLLEETALPLKAVASRAGLGDVSTLWRAFSQQLGVTPEEYRMRFSSAPRRRQPPRPERDKPQDGTSRSAEAPASHEFLLRRPAGLT
jgi:transcriptional regulator GlxA family with amidase domain